MLQFPREGRVIDEVKIRLRTIHDISLGGGGGGGFFGGGGFPVFKGGGGGGGGVGGLCGGGVPGFQRERTGISRRQQGNNVSRAFITKTFFSLFFFFY